MACACSGNRPPVRAAHQPTLYNAFSFEPCTRVQRLQFTVLGAPRKGSLLQAAERRRRLRRSRRAGRAGASLGGVKGAHTRDYLWEEAPEQEGAQRSYEQPHAVPRNTAQPRS